MIPERVTEADWTLIDPIAELRVLFSGGLESAVLIGEAVLAGLKPIPVYVSTGARWESDELEAAIIYLKSIDEGLSDNMVFYESIAGKNEDHWAYNETRYPLAGEDIQTLKIGKRNETLLRAAATIDSDNHNVIIAIGTTEDNPFSDGTRQYFDYMETKLTMESGNHVSILSPLIGLKKSDVIIRGKRFPLGLTLSCIAPRDAEACGECIKCGSRAAAFLEAGVTDKYEKEEVNEF